VTLKDIKLQDFPLKAFLVFVFFCPIFFDPLKTQGYLRLNQEQFFQVGATLLFAICFLENIYLSLFLIWSVVLYAYYGFPGIGGNYVMNIFWASVVYQVTYKLINSNNVDKLYKTIIYLCILNIAWMALQLFNFDLIFMDRGEYAVSPCGLFGLKCFMGMFLAL